MNREEWDRRYAGRELVWTAKPNGFLVAEVSELPRGRALDLACGEGRNAVWLAARGWEVTAVDFSERGLEKARRLAAERGVEVTWVASDLLGYRPEPQAYVLVILFYLQVPAAELRPIVRAAAESVAPGGTFLLVGHDLRNLERGHGGPKSAEVLYTPEDVVAALGPAIGACCYEVGDEVREAFGPQGAAFFRPGPNGRPHLDIRAANVKQLLDAGVSPGRIHHVADCTFCRADVYHSFRREGRGAGRMVNFVGFAR